MLQAAVNLGLGLVLGFSLGRMQAKRDLEGDRENIRKRPLSRPTSSGEDPAACGMPNAKEIAAAKAARARLGYEGAAQASWPRGLKVLNECDLVRAAKSDVWNICKLRLAVTTLESCQTVQSLLHKILIIWIPANSSLWLLQGQLLR